MTKLYNTLKAPKNYLNAFIEGHRLPSFFRSIASIYLFQFETRRNFVINSLNYVKKLILLNLRLSFFYHKYIYLLEMNKLYFNPFLKYRTQKKDKKNG